MTQAYGQLGTIQYNFQDSFGSPIVASLEGTPFMSEGLSETIGQLVEDNIRGRHAAGPTHEGVRESAGAIRLQPLPDNLGMFLYGACGQITSTVVDSANQHVMFPLVSTDYGDRMAMRPLTLVADRDVSSLASAYGDMLVNEITLEAAHSQLLAMNVGLVGGIHYTTVKTAAVLPEGKPWTWDQGSMSWGGVAVPELRSLTWTQNNNLAPFHTLTDSKTPHRVERSDNPMVTGTATVKVTAEVHSYFLSLFDNQTESQLLVNFDGITSPGNLLLDAPKARITAYAPTMGGTGPIEADIQFDAKFDETSNYLCQYTLTNCRVSYP